MTNERGEVVVDESVLELADQLERLECSVPCRVEDPELWFAETPDGVEDAKSRCLDCPLRARCLAGAVERREPWGVWGGELFERGAVIARKRPRGRPRKDALSASTAA